MIVSVLVELQTYGLISKKGVHHRCFSMKIGKFYGISILQYNAARLLLICHGIFNVLLTLSVINQFSHSMWIYIVIIIIINFFYIGSLINIFYKIFILQ